MVHILVISIILLPIVTASDDDFWKDVDEKSNELSDPIDLSTIGQNQLVASPSKGSHSSNQVQKATVRRKIEQKHASFSVDEMVSFVQAVTIDKLYPTTLSETEIIEKLHELGNAHAWPHLRMYNVEGYSKYWAKVCAFFSKINLTNIQRVVCRLTPSYGTAKLRKTEYRGKIQTFDLLGCNCHGYQVNYLKADTNKELFLIHQSSAHEFFIFEHKKHACNRLFIKNFKGGITLPNPIDFKNVNQ